jgi:HIRAN domain
MVRLIAILVALAAIAVAFFYRLGHRFGRDKAIDDVAKTFGDRLIGGPEPADVELAVWGEEQPNADGSSRQDIITKLREGDEIELIRHPGDVDKNMIAVVSEKGEIGRLTQADAATLAPYMDRGGRVRAQVSAIRGGTKDRPELNVWILVRTLDQI